MKFGMGKLLAMVAAYSIWLAALVPFGTPGICGGLFCGTTTSLIIIVAKRGDVLQIIRCVVGGLLGAFVGFVFLSPLALKGMYGSSRGFGEAQMLDLCCAIIGAFAGAYLLSRFTRPYTNPREEPADE